jgi:RimJ/RimL family protein N-acetyltransferase
MIETARLHLCIIEPQHVEALARNKSELAALLHVAVPANWPHFPEAFSLPTSDSPKAEPSPTDWNGYFFLHRNDYVLIGNGGFKGEPDASGTIEIGYEIASDYWNRGFATEAARGMIDFAFAHREVLAVMAHTLAETNASNRVLQKLGMRFVAEIDHPEDGKIWRWQLRRATEDTP